ncbi:MAG: sodium:solute symporter [Bacteroidaceae bacterium]|nr:sodium:solute symporter [Bacteroidaceae bacterium]
MALTVILVVAYGALLAVVSRLTARRADNDTFFSGGRRSPWWAVAFGMLGASLSGVTFVSVPGMVCAADMTYLQMCLGFIPGYIAVAFLLLPVYYRLGLTSIYAYLDRRFGLTAYRTGASFFLLSKLLGAAVRLYLVCLILQRLVFDALGLPFWLSAVIILVLIWLYTHRGGIGTIVWTDCLQTAVLLVALVLILAALLHAEGWGIGEAVRQVRASRMSRIFEFSDWQSRQYFWKQFLSGAFIVVVMTGLDQDMMQKNLTCRTLRASQKNMIVNGLLYVPVNLLFLGLGVLMYLFAAHRAIALPPSGDEVLPLLCAGGWLGQGALAFFTLGIAAAALSSADSALTALTTSTVCDLFQRPDDERLRRRVHIAMSLFLLALILAFRALNSTSVIDAVYVIASYTYGPLLGLFAFGLFAPARLRPVPRVIPFICLASPVLCYLLSLLSAALWQYHFGYELLLLNGALTALGLWLSCPRSHDAPATKQPKVYLIKRHPGGRAFLAICLFGAVFSVRPLTAVELNHERIHAAQQRELLYVPFFIWYVVEWLFLWAKYGDRMKAYEHIRFEKEAYRHQGDLQYLSRRKHYRYT